MLKNLFKALTLIHFFFLDRFNFNFFFQRVKNLNKTNLAFIYNLNLDPITFDFGHFLIEAELFRKKKKLKKIDVYIVKNNKAVPARMLKFIKSHSRNELKNRIYEIILPITRLLDSVGSTMILEHDFFLKIPGTILRIIVKTTHNHNYSFNHN